MNNWHCLIISNWHEIGGDFPPISGQIPQTFYRFDSLNWEVVIAISESIHYFENVQIVFFLFLE